MSNMTWLTPSFVSTILTLVAIAMLVIGFLIGFRRGIFGATYRFVVSFVVVLGLWCLLPVVTNKLLSINLNKFGVDILNIFGYSEVSGMEVNSIKDGVNILSRLFLGLAESNDGIIILKETSIDVTTTLLYGTVISMLEMLLRIVLLIIILLLNWSLFRFIFFIVYKCSKPKQEDKEKQKKPMKSRLIGGAIGFVNMIAILLIISIPLSGIMNIAEKAVSLVEYQEQNKEEVVNLSFGSEVIELNSEEPIIETIKEYSEWTHVYRKSFCGGLFGLKFGGTEFDCIMFDGMFSFKSGKEKVSIRKEFAICVDSVNILKEDIIIPYLENGKFTPEMLDSLSSEKVNKTLDKLSNLKIVNVAFKIGMESVIIMAENDSSIFENYVLVKDIIVALNEKEINLSDFISQLGDLSTALMDLVEASGYKLSELISSEDGQTTKNYVDALLKIDTDVVVNVFEKISEIEIINIIFETSFSQLEDYVNENESAQKFILLYPKLSVSDDKYFVINETKTTVPYQSEDLDKVSLSITSDNKWIIGDAVTTVDASNNIFNLNLEGIKITDEIKNIGSLYNAFKELNINSFSQIQNFIDNGPSKDSIDLEKITYEKINALFQALLNFKLITKSENNLYVILNNILPNDYHGLIKMSELTSEDLASLVYAAKAVAQTGLLWNTEDKIKDDGQINYAKVKVYFDAIKEDLAENLVKSNIVVENIDTVVNYALSLFLPELQLNLSVVNWETEGKEELSKLFDAVSILLKYGNKLFNNYLPMSDSEIDDMISSLKESIADSKILQKNMNNLVKIITSNESLKELGVVITPIDEDEWTTEEINALFEAFKIVLKKYDEAKEEDEVDIFKLLNLTAEEIDTFLTSKFISKNLAYNICELTKEGNKLHEKIIVNLDANSNKWYDTYENGKRVKDGELRILLTNFEKIIRDLQYFKDENRRIEQIIRNIIALNNNFQGEDDEVGYLLSSTILSDTLIYYFENIEKLSEELVDLIVVPNDVIWEDTTEEGELRKILKACKYVIGHNVSENLEKLKSGNSNEILEVLLRIEDEHIDQIFDSRVITETAVSFVEKYSSEEENKTFTIFLQNKERDTEYWQEELPKIFKGMKVILLENNNLIDLNRDIEKNIDLLQGLTDDEIDKLLASEILVDTLAHFIIKMADEDNAIFVVKDSWRCDDDNWNEANTAMWREEFSKIVAGVEVLLFDKNGSSRYAVFTKGSSEEMINVIIDISEDDYDAVTSSEIITDTISNIIINMGDDSGVIISEKVKNFSTSQWQEEIKDVITSMKTLLIDSKGVKQTKKLFSSDNNEKIELITNLGDDEQKISKALNSEIVYDTVTETIKKLGNDDITLPNDINSWGRNEWIAEVKALIYSANNLLRNSSGKIDIEGQVSNVNNLLTKITSLTNDINSSNDELGKILESQIICETIISKIKEQSTTKGGKLVISSTISWKDSKTGNKVQEGELRKLFRTVSIIFDGNIDIENFDTNKVLKLTDKELDDVFDSQIVLDTFYDMIEDLTKGNNAVLAIKEGTAKDKAEAKRFVNSIKVVIEEKDIDISDIDSTNFQFDDFIKLEDSKIDVLLASEIISYSAAKKTKEILETDLQEYVLLKGTTDEEKLTFVSNDLKNLFIVIRDLEEKHNISYNNFSFDSFCQTISNQPTEEKKTAKADAIAETLLKSSIIDNSIEKMISSILDKALDDEMKADINLNMNDGTTNKWHDQGNNPGEFKKVFRLLVYVDKFTGNNANELSKTTNPEDISKPLKAINDSLVLCGVIPTFINKATEGVDTWRYNKTSALYQDPKTLTKDEWDNEIDIISDIVALVNKENLTDINSLNVKTLPLNSLETLLKDVAKSRILDISCIEGIVEKGVRETFTNISSNKLNVVSVYTGSSYETKVRKWNNEIDALISAIEALRNIESTDTSDKKVITNSKYGDKYQGVHNARMIGQFLDKCEESIMLEGIIISVAQSFYPSITQESIKSASLEEIMVGLAKIQIQYGF